MASRWTRNVFIWLWKLFYLRTFGHEIETKRTLVNQKKISKNISHNYSFDLKKYSTFTLAQILGSKRTMFFLSTILSALDTASSKNLIFSQGLEDKFHVISLSYCVDSTRIHQISKMYRYISLVNLMVEEWR